MYTGKYISNKDKLDHPPLRYTISRYGLSQHSLISSRSLVGQLFHIIKPNMRIHYVVFQAGGKPSCKQCTINTNTSFYKHIFNEFSPVNAKTGNKAITTNQRLLLKLLNTTTKRLKHKHKVFWGWFPINPDYWLLLY